MDDGTPSNENKEVISYSDICDLTIPFSEEIVDVTHLFKQDIDIDTHANKSNGESNEVSLIKDPTIHFRSLN